MMTERDVMQAIVTLYNGVSDFSEYVHCNDVIDNYRTEFPENPLTDMLNRYVEACEEYDQRTIDRVAMYAMDWLND